MSYSIKQSLTAVAAPPISEAFSWIPEDAGGRPFIQLSQAVPGYPPAEELQRHLARRTGQHDTSLYTDILGIPPLREALAADIASDYAAKIKMLASNIAITAGGNQAFCLAILALAQPGDNVILCEPYFFNHKMWLEMNGIEVRLVPCAPDAGMLPDPDVAGRIADDRTKAVVLVSPNNPTGAIYPPHLLSRFFDMAASAHCALIIDETYKDFRAGGQPAHDLFQRERWDETFIHLYSFSKVFSLTGYRVGALAASAKLVEEIEKVMDCVAICAPRIAQDAALFGLQHLDEWKRRKQADNAGRLTAFREALSHCELRYELVSSGAFFGYLRHPFAGVGSFEVARRLARQHGILVLPGAMFGPNQERYLRLAFANVEADVMPEVAQRLVESQSGG